MEEHKAKWLFTFDFYESNQYQDDYLHRTVKLYASSKKEAFDKLRTLVSVWNNLSWNCKEVK